ncbi:Cell death protease [Geranomyces variabilis]|uniref:Pheromone-processing carboxypeptidase KEX1 n=1 Tax=Geranomyces variabilis TaxID=109894 RepID=A0AAD5TS74_9FUNG|nr:Cell death protease [Geranomyces variabilis]
MDGMLLENGPFKIKPGGAVGVNPTSWVHNANMLYVDQPAGTGFSIVNGKYVTSQSQSADEFLSFLENFYLTFPEYRNSELYFTGESFAGQYIPYVGHEILKRNRNGAYAPPLNLRGLVIGNGWVDPLRQYKSYIDFSAAHGLLQIPKYKQAADDSWKYCQEAMATKELIKQNTCERIIDYIQSESKEGGKLCINMYDIRLRDEKPNQGCGMGWPPGLDDTKNYLQLAEVRSALHVNEPLANKWHECDNGVYRELADDLSPPSYTIEVTFFSGDQDLICNWMGTRDMIAELTWGDQKGFQGAPVMNWLIDNQLKGTYQEARNLSFVIIHNASHMVPVDEPVAALDMFNRAIRATDTINSIVIDPSDPTTLKPIAGDKEAGQEDGSEPASPGSSGRHYYAGAVLLILMLVGMAGCATYRMRDKIDLTAVKAIVNRIRGRAGHLAERHDSNWHEVQGDEEALFVAEDLDDSLAMGNMRR